MEEEDLETRIYYLNQGVAMFTEFSGKTAGATGGFGGAASISKVNTIKDVLESASPRVMHAHRIVGRDRSIEKRIALVG